MIVKWIVCDVENDQKSAFSKAQEQWSEIAGAKGFLAQTGGWEVDHQNTACIIAFWESAGDLDYFMRNLHNKIFQDSHQGATYRSIDIGHFNVKMTMPGSARSLTDVARDGRLLRIADCTVRNDKTSHFEKVQHDIWLPAMRDSSGMLGGVFSLNTVRDNHYLVSSFWESEDDHSNYVASKLPVLQQKADIKNDLLDITGKKVRLLDAWSVIKP